MECLWLILPAAPFAGRVAHALVTRTPDLVSASFVWRSCFAFSLDCRSLRARTATQCASFSASRRRSREPKLDPSQKHASVASQCACVAVAGLRSAPCLKFVPASRSCTARRAKHTQNDLGASISRTQRAPLLSFGPLAQCGPRRACLGALPPHLVAVLLVQGDGLFDSGAKPKSVIPRIPLAQETRLLRCVWAVCAHAWEAGAASDGGGGEGGSSGTTVAVLERRPGRGIGVCRCCLAAA